MNFLEADVQGSEFICHDLMNDITAVEEGSAESREFIGNAHSVSITADAVVITSNVGNTTGSAEGDAKPDSDMDTEYKTTLKHFSEVLADWEAFILDEEDPIDDSLHV